LEGVLSHKTTTTDDNGDVDDVSLDDIGSHDGNDYDLCVSGAEK
jgi:hypothetical protein